MLSYNSAYFAIADNANTPAQIKTTTTHPPGLGNPLPSGLLHSIAYALKFFDDSISMVALDFDLSVLDRPASAKPVFQLGCKLGKTAFI